MDDNNSNNEIKDASIINNDDNSEVANNNTETNEQAPNDNTRNGNGYKGLASNNREAFTRGLNDNYADRIVRNKANLAQAKARSNETQKKGEDGKLEDKNSLDRAKDKANVLKNKTALMGSKIDNARSKAFQMMHPIEAKKIIAKKAIKKWLICILLSSLPMFLCIFLVFFACFYVLGLFDSEESSFSAGLVDSNEKVTISSSGSYWWPIGGSEVETIDGVKYATGNPTSTVITSKFSKSRTINGVTKPHRGIDIGKNGLDLNYIIASKDGTVYKANNGCPTNGYYGSSCGGQYGNYVILEHTDGNYTIYAHMAKDSVTVSVGNKVKQGQIIGKMGNSGSSTGTHLHFQIDVGAYSNTNAVDPLTYVNINNPRPKFEASNLITMLHLLEGSGPTNGSYYVAYHGAADAEDIITIGHGVVIKYNIDKFKARGYSNPVKDITEGTKVLKTIVDEIETEILKERRNNIVNKLNNKSISLYDYQVDALVCRDYNVGNIDNFYNSYKQYGVTQALYDNYMSKPVKANGKYVKALETRRKREWKLFKEGLYYGVDYN